MSTDNSDAKGGIGLRVTNDELGTHALAIISYLYNRVIGGAAAALRKRTGLSLTEARIVFQVGAAELTTANKLARNLAIDKAAISRATNRLVELGLMTSERDPLNAASNLLTLTEAGQVQCKFIAHFTFAREEYLLNVLSEDEQQQFLDYLRRILTNVESLNTLVAQGRFWDA